MSIVIVGLTSVPHLVRFFCGEEVVVVDKKSGESVVQGANINVNLDTTPILYTDNVLISVNEAGVVLDFCQQLISTNQVRVVARIGLSRQHSKKFSDQLEAMIKVAEGQAQSSEKKLNIN